LDLGARKRAAAAAKHFQTLFKIEGYKTTADARAEDKIPQSKTRGGYYP